MPRGNGGVIGPANIPTTASAKGVWSLVEQMIAQSQGIWPFTVLSDPYFEYTTLLLPGNGTNGAQNNTFLDSSTNNFTITRNGNTTQGTFSPFSQTGWGNYFSGSSTNLSVASTTALQFGTGEFTVESWVYLTATPGAQYAQIIGRTLYGTNADWMLQITNATKLTFYMQGSFVATSTASISLNTWTHVAVSRNSSGQIRLFINGSIDGTATNSGSTENTSSGAYTIGSAQSASTVVLTGYLSNLRAVKGVCVYTGAFTPPTSPLTATQSAGTNISAITGTQTSLLTCQSNRFVDNSVANSGTGFTITVNGNTSVQAFSPFNPSASWSAATYGGSGYFDGTGDYLSNASDAILPATGDFTIEFWIYPTQVSTLQYMFGTGGGTPLYFYINSSAYIGVQTGGSYRDSATTKVIANAWNYIVLTRTGSTYAIYLNGVSQSISGSGTMASSLTNTPTYMGTYSAVAYFTTGYISSFRISNIVRSVSVPTSPYVSDANTSLLLNYTNAGIYDATSKNDLETVGDAQISTAQSKWGGSSMAFDGTTDYLYQAPTPFIRLGTGDFTCECWVRFNVVTGTQGIFQLADSYLQSSLSNNGVGLSTTSGTGWLFFAKNSQTFTYSPIVPAAANTWMHVALVRYSGTTKLYVNGTGDAALTASSDTTNYTATYLALGGVYGGNSLNGYIQDFRITVGVARYTANFTPPTAAFPTL